MTAMDLIERSVSHTEIVSADWTAELAEELDLECEDSLEASETTVEYWGTTDDGGEWRVHLHGRRVEPDSTYRIECRESGRWTTDTLGGARQAGGYTTVAEAVGAIRSLAALGEEWLGEYRVGRV